MVKSVLLGLLVGLGWINHHRIHGRAHWFPRLRRNLSVELTIFVVVLATVAVLTQSRPGRDRLLAAAARAGSAAAGP